MTAESVVSNSEFRSNRTGLGWSGICLFQPTCNADDLGNSAKLLRIYGQTDLIQRTPDDLTVVIDQSGAHIGAHAAGKHLLSPGLGKGVVYPVSFS